MHDQCRHIARQTTHPVHSGRKPSGTHGGHTSGGTSTHTVLPFRMTSRNSTMIQTYNQEIPMQKPSLGRIVHYRGKQGLLAMRAAIVTCDTKSLDPRGVEQGLIPDLADDEHVHLWVFTPGESGGFTEYNVPLGHAEENSGEIPPGSWCWPPRV